MSIRPDAREIALRLILTLIAGGVLGLNRVERDRPAGLRTTMLVCLTAAVGMLQTVLLIDTTGKASDSFVVMDVMRIPLGILSGMGFIGGGTILRRENLVIGVTTASTLWFATMVGLCLGGGQLALGIAATVLGAVILWCLRWVEQRIKQQRHGILTFAIEGSAGEEEIRLGITGSGFKVASQAVTYIASPPRRKLSWQVAWVSRASVTDPPIFLRDLAARPDVTELEWQEVHNSPG